MSPLAEETAVEKQPRVLKMVSRNSFATSGPLKVHSVRTSSTGSLRFSMPLNTPVLLRVLALLRAMTPEQVGLVEVVAKAIAKGDQ